MEGSPVEQEQQPSPVGVVLEAAVAFLARGGWEILAAWDVGADLPPSLHGAVIARRSGVLVPVPVASPGKFAGQFSAALWRLCVQDWIDANPVHAGTVVKSRVLHLLPGDPPGLEWANPDWTLPHRPDQCGTGCR